MDQRYSYLIHLTVNQYTWISLHLLLLSTLVFPITIQALINVPWSRVVMLIQFWLLTTNSENAPSHQSSQPVISSFCKNSMFFKKLKAFSYSNFFLTFSIMVQIFMNCRELNCMCNFPNAELEIHSNDHRKCLVWVNDEWQDESTCIAVSRMFYIIRKL